MNWYNLLYRNTALYKPVVHELESAIGTWSGDPPLKNEWVHIHSFSTCALEKNFYLFSDTSAAHLFFLAGVSWATVFTTSGVVTLSSKYTFVDGPALVLQVWRYENMMEFGALSCTGYRAFHFTQTNNIHLSGGRQETDNALGHCTFINTCRVIVGDRNPRYQREERQGIRTNREILLRKPV